MADHAKVMAEKSKVITCPYSGLSCLCGDTSKCIQRPDGWKAWVRKRE